MSEKFLPIGFIPELYKQKQTHSEHNLRKDKNKEKLPPSISWDNKKQSEVNSESIKIEIEKVQEVILSNKKRYMEVNQKMQSIKTKIRQLQKKEQIIDEQLTQVVFKQISFCYKLERTQNQQEKGSLQIMIDQVKEEINMKNLLKNSVLQEMNLFQIQRDNCLQIYDSLIQQRGIYNMELSRLTNILIGFSSFRNNNLR